MTTGFSTDDARILNEESARALSSILAKAAAAEPDRHRDFVLSSCAVALRYLEQIHIFGTSGYSPIALSLSRSFFEIVCGTIYLAENKSELEDFVSFGRLTLFEMREKQGLPGKLLNQIAPDRLELQERFNEKKKRLGGHQLSWHGMQLEELARRAGMEEFANTESDRKLRRNHYKVASKIVHGDSLISLLAYNIDIHGLNPTPFAVPSSAIAADALNPSCLWFLILIGAVGEALSIDHSAEWDRLDKTWKEVWARADGRRSLSRPNPT